MDDHDSQMDAQGIDTIDTAGMPGDEGPGSRSNLHPQPQPVQDVIQSAINSAEFNSAQYTICPKVGKAVIVSNFMEKDEPIKKNPKDPECEPIKKNPKDPECRRYASQDCTDLESVLNSLGFEPLTGDVMVHKNLTKKQFTELYERAAKKEDYRPENGKGYTCVLFIVMSYGRSGLIKCHAEDSNGEHEYVEQKHIQEAFQPQNNHSLALKPKIFIIQTIPEPTDKADGDLAKDVKITKRIPREADFLTYSCDSYCLSNKEGCHENIFARSIVNILTDIAKDKENEQPALEIQRMFIRMNKDYKDKRTSDNWKIPCVTSSLTKQLKLYRDRSILSMQI